MQSLRDLCHNSERISHSLDRVLPESGIRAISPYVTFEVLEKVDFSKKPNNPKPMKQIARLFRDMFGKKLDNEQLNRIGNLLNLHLTDDKDYQFDIVDSVDWRAGDFGDYGSCYWSDNSGARQALTEDDNSFAIRFYDSNGKGIGRAWLYLPDSHSVIIYNGYGLESLEIAKVLSDYLDLPYAKIGLTNERAKTGLVYINNGGYWLGENPRDYDMRIDTECHYTRCHNCDEPTPPDYIYYSDIENHEYCEDCYHEQFTRCEHCENEIYSDDEIHLEIYNARLGRKEDAYYCEDCASNEGYRECYSCETVKEIVAEYDGEEYCEDCDPGGFCEDCGLTDYEVYDHNDTTYCAHCLEQYRRCTVCGDQHMTRDLKLEDQHGRVKYVCGQCSGKTLCQCGQWSAIVISSARGFCCEHCDNVQVGRYETRAGDCQHSQCDHKTVLSSGYCELHQNTSLQLALFE